MPKLLPWMFSWLHTPAASHARQAPEREKWLRDPLSHPSIAAMSGEQLADLPTAELRARARC